MFEKNTFKLNTKICAGIVSVAILATGMCTACQKTKDLKQNKNISKINNETTKDKKVVDKETSKEKQSHNKETDTTTGKVNNKDEKYETTEEIITDDFEMVTETSASTKNETQSDTLGEQETTEFMGYSATHIAELAQNYYEKTNGTKPPHVSFTIDEWGIETVQFYEEIDDGEYSRNTTWDWYTINMKSGECSNVIGDTFNIYDSDKVLGVYENNTDLEYQIKCVCEDYDGCIPEYVYIEQLSDNVIKAKCYNVIDNGNIDVKQIYTIDCSTGNFTNFNGETRTILG